MGSKKQTTVQNYSNETKLDPVYEAASHDLIQRGQAIADRPYVAYTGQRVANLSANEQKAIDLAATNLDEPRKYMDLAGRTVGDVKNLAGADLSPYMNPYKDAVIDPQLREANLAFDQSRNKILSTKSQRSAFGGDRQSFLESENDRMRAQTLGDITGKGNYDAFNFAVSAFQNDQDRKLRAADAYRAVGGDMARLNNQQMKDLLATGGVERLVQQAGLDTKYEEFLTNRDWSVANMEPLLRTLGTVQTGRSESGSSTTTTKTTGSTVGEILGAAATIAGAYFTGGASLLGAGAATSASLGAAATVAGKLSDSSISSSFGTIAPIKP